MLIIWYCLCYVQSQFHTVIDTIIDTIHIESTFFQKSLIACRALADKRDFGAWDTTTCINLHIYGK